MKIALLPLLPILALALVFGGCEKTAPAPDSAVLFQTLRDNVSALEKKDVDAVMATIHPKAPSFESTRAIVSDMFKAIDLKYTLTDLKVVTASEDEAQVSFVQKTEKKGGAGEFPGNIVEGIHTLKLDNGKWKIFRTLQMKVTDLNGKPIGAPEPAAPAPEPPPSPTPAAEPAPKPAPPAAPATPRPATPAEKPAP